MARITTRIENFRGKLALVPARQRDLDVLAEVKTKGLLQTTVLKFTRSHELHNWYWALVSHCADGLGIHKDDLHAQLKFKAGLVQSYLLGESGPVVVLKSTAYGAMEAGPFREYVELATEILFKSYLPEVRRKDVLAEVERMVGPRPR